MVGDDLPHSKSKQYTGIWTPHPLNMTAEESSSADITVTDNAVNKQLLLSFSKYTRKYISEYILTSYKKMRLEKVI